MMKLWKDGKIAELVEDTVATARRGTGGQRKDDNDESIAHRYLLDGPGRKAP